MHNPGLELGLIFAHALGGTAEFIDKDPSA